MAVIANNNFTVPARLQRAAMLRQSALPTKLAGKEILGSGLADVTGEYLEVAGSIPALVTPDSSVVERLGKPDRTSPEAGGTE